MNDACICVQHISDDMWWYYMVELGFYWSLIYSLFMDNKRKVRFYRCYRVICLQVALLLLSEPVVKSL